MSDSGKKDGDPDNTQVGGQPPRAPRPAAPSSAADSTGVTPVARPPVPQRPEAVAPAPGQPPKPTEGESPPPAAVGDDTLSRQSAPPKPPGLEKQGGAAENEPEEGTLLVKREPVTLTRLAPAEHFAVIPLEDRTYRLGRSSSCDVQLFSPEGSRDHARLRKEPSGWVIEPAEGKLVLVNGAKAEGPVNLGRKSRLRLGGDDLLFVDESPAPSAAPVAKAAESETVHRSRSRTWIVIAVALLIGAAAAVLLMSR